MRSFGYHNQFLPRSHITKPEIEQAIAAALYKSRQNLRNRLQPWKSKVDSTKGKSYQKIFVILSIMSRPSKIRLFVKRGVSDTDLPLERIPSAISTRGQHQLRSRSNPGATPLSFSKRKDVDDFVQTQWAVLAPDFELVEGKPIPHRDLEPEAVPPFTSMARAEAGGHGQVFRTETHPDHYTFGRAQV